MSLADAREFLSQVRSDAGLKDDFHRIIENKGGMTAEGVIELAREAGYEFDREEYSTAVQEYAEESNQTSLDITGETLFSSENTEIGACTGVTTGSCTYKSSCKSWCEEDKYA